MGNPNKERPRSLESVWNKNTIPTPSLYFIKLWVLLEKNLYFQSTTYRSFSQCGMYLYFFHSRLSIQKHISRVAGGAKNIREDYMRKMPQGVQGQTYGHMHNCFNTL